MLINDGDDDSGGGTDDLDDLFDLGFNDEPADLNEADMTPGTEPPVVVQDLSGTPPAPVPVTAQATETPPAPAPTTSPPAATTPPATTVPPVPATTETPPSATESEPSVNIEEYVAANADAIIGNLAGSHFKIDDATAQALGFSPELREFVEKRDAKNFLLTMVQMNKALQATLPQVVANLMDVTHKVKETHNEFFTEFKDLADKKYVPHLKQIATTLRALNPTMAKPEFMKLLGTTARTMFGLPAPAPQPQNGQQRPGVRRGQSRPFVPAGSVAPQRAQQAQQSSGLDFLNDSLRLGADD